MLRYCARCLSPLRDANPGPSLGGSRFHCPRCGQVETIFTPDGPLAKVSPALLRQVLPPVQIALASTAGQKACRACRRLFSPPPGRERWRLCRPCARRLVFRQAVQP